MTRSSIRQNKTSHILFKSPQVLFYDFLDFTHNPAAEGQYRQHKDAAEDRVYPVAQRPLGQLVFNVLILDSL